MGYRIDGGDGTPTVKDLQQQARRINIDNGWGAPDHKFGGHVNHDIIRLALVGTEVAEAIEVLRKGGGPSEHIEGCAAFEEELADIVIRVMDIAEDRSIDLGDVIQRKLEYNRQRGYRHGGKVV